MKETSSFLIYNASAGSGKTYSLVKAFLKTLLLNSSPDYYKYLLAITFTNKAVGEMKERIIEYLRRFSEAIPDERIPEMMETLSLECNLSVEQLRSKSKSILHHLLHHYAAFSVETIDSFNHRLIRTFARDLKIASNFEVSLDESELLEQAVDNLLQRAGEDREITEALVKFTLAKTDDDRSWDISRDITEASGILFKENELDHVQRLKDKSLPEFRKIASKLQSELESITLQIKEKALEILELIDESGLQFTDFNRSSYPNHMLKLAEGNDPKFDAKWQETLRDKPLYPAKLLKESAHSATVIDEITPALADAFDQTKQLSFRKKFVRSLLNNLTPLSVINLVQQELDVIKEEENLLPISEFNRLINAEIKNQPAPFIYERLGERYRHFFVDEFQDTSKLQWENLVPLIDNSLAQEQDDIPGSLLLVGDAKQSIYRWRGGLPEQFIDLYNCENPFSVSNKDVINLDINWRSCATIIEFNNAFFTHLSQHFNRPEHEELYTLGNQQKKNYKEGGYVRLEFIDFNKKEDADPLYAERVYQTVRELLNQGFSLNDICILTRRKKEGIALGEILMEKGLPVVSSESLLLQHSPIVRFLADFLQFRTQPNNDELKTSLICFMHRHFEINEPLSGFLQSFFPSEKNNFNATLHQYGIDLNIEKTFGLTLYECCEYALKSLALLPKVDVYVEGFMNIIFDFEQRQTLLTQTFTDYWYNKKEKAAITVGEGLDALRLMTIHKAKGLEFPVVLFPHADVDIYYEKAAKTWMNARDLVGDDEPFRINFNKDIAEFNEEGAAIYEERRSRQQLDNFNLLYVTLTRAVEQLYIFSKNVTSNKRDDLKKYNEFFQSFLKSQDLWEENKNTYEFGSPLRGVEKTKIHTPDEVPLYYQTTFPEDLNLQVASRGAALWQTDAEIAISAGTVLHDLMENIRRNEDVDETIEEFKIGSDLEDSELKRIEEMIRNIVTHPEITHYFDSESVVETERDLITSDGRLLRPDRINFHKDNKITIIDYKTGGKSPKHMQQLDEYGEALEDMGYSVINKLIIYASEDKISINKL
ncbi:MAG: UvrD-helicase domain-containing protein [Bacteroidia bacterium]|nr:UvrD-helicase domain-containing protein [Bacteroidia bacterium]NNF31425.1 UvrD-helicase domain-containing protein [Flavobacteriaceae bacterium]NNJ80901.1 UvrD-helicase domain-containing protein [Flavobacteriaceae bacterium]NNK54004.1 UvrD-helicase domain-containing protein [Flavobacteriaceae bacterium]NNM07581.1 UvrD-helicase domain-containing protein [Flavobacteriaceae bacterium]